jgi:hypothetical protein
MLKITLLITAAVTLAGCASARQERAAAFQQQLPQLVTACNALADPSGDAATSRRDAAEACERLALNKSLGLADPPTVRAYLRYRAGVVQGQVSRSAPSAPTIIPAPLPQVQ